MPWGRPAFSAGATRVPCRMGAGNNAAGASRRRDCHFPGHSRRAPRSSSRHKDDGGAAVAVDAAVVGAGGGSVARDVGGADAVGGVDDGGDGGATACSSRRRGWECNSPASTPQSAEIWDHCKESSSNTNS